MHVGVARREPVSLLGESARRTGVAVRAPHAGPGEERDGVRAAGRARERGRRRLAVAPTEERLPAEEPGAGLRRLREEGEGLRVLSASEEEARGLGLDGGIAGRRRERGIDRGLHLGERSSFTGQLEGALERRPRLLRGALEPRGQGSLVLARQAGVVQEAPVRFIDDRRELHSLREIGEEAREGEGLAGSLGDLAVGVRRGVSPRAREQHGPEEAGLDGRPERGRAVERLHRPGVVSPEPESPRSKRDGGRIGTGPHDRALEVLGQLSADVDVSTLRPGAGDERGAIRYRGQGEGVREESRRVAGPELQGLVRAVERRAGPLVAPGARDGVLLLDEGLVDDALGLVARDEEPDEEDERLGEPLRPERLLGQALRIAAPFVEEREERPREETARAPGIRGGELPERVARPFPRVDVT